MLRDTSENISDKWSLNHLKQEIISSITKQVGEGAEVKATSIEDETFRDEIKNTASRWKKEISNKAQVVVLVPTGIYAFDKFFNLPDLDITFFGIGSHRYFLFHYHSKVLICDTQYAICGSANWMSNTGYYNREVSVKIEEPGLIKDLLSEAEKDFVN